MTTEEKIMKVKKFLGIILLCSFLSTPPASGEWRAIKHWQGNGMMTTESFNVNSRQWRISWDFRADNVYEELFQIFAYNKGIHIPEIVANQSKSGRGISYIHSRGEYYLTINSLGTWAVMVEEE